MMYTDVPMNVPMLYYDIICAILFSHPHFQVGLSRASWQDAYYLLEIDPWGRRFYHRGGMRTGAAGAVAVSGGSGSTYSDVGYHKLEAFLHIHSTLS